jgi:hypothetical protein
LLHFTHGLLVGFLSGALHVLHILHGCLLRGLSRFDGLGASVVLSGSERGGAKKGEKQEGGALGFSRQGDGRDRCRVTE